MIYRKPIFTEAHMKKMKFIQSSLLLHSQSTYVKSFHLFMFLDNPFH